MRPFNQNESGYTATALHVAFPAVVTQTTVGSTSLVLNVISTANLVAGNTIVVGSEVAMIQSMTAASITLTTHLKEAPSAGVNVSLAYLYSPEKLDIPPRKKANFALIASNIRNAQGGYLCL